MDALNRLKSFSSLKPDWDSYGAKSIELSEISRAYSIVSALIDQGISTAYAFPSPLGGVQLEWVNGLDELEAGFESGESIGCLACEGDDMLEFEATREQLIGAVKLLFTRLDRGDHPCSSSTAATEGH